VIELAALAVLARSALADLGNSSGISVAPLVDLGRRLILFYAEGHGISTNQLYDAIAAFNEAGHRLAAFA
jgi:hypothetical protein